jgi:hypothetical protein
VYRPLHLPVIMQIWCTYYHICAGESRSAAASRSPASRAPASNAAVGSAPAGSPPANAGGVSAGNLSSPSQPPPPTPIPMLADWLKNNKSEEKRLANAKKGDAHRAAMDSLTSTVERGCTAIQDMAAVVKAALLPANNEASAGNSSNSTSAAKCRNAVISRIKSWSVEDIKNWAVHSCTLSVRAAR